MFHTLKFHFIEVQGIASPAEEGLGRASSPP